jgi:hypothetical protein
MIVAVSSVSEEAQRQQQPGTSTSAAAKAGSSKWVIDDKVQLASTGEHRAYTLGSIALLGATFAHALAGCSDAADYSAVGASFLAAYVLSDLGTGIYHWSVDNYGDGNTPLVRGGRCGCACVCVCVCVCAAAAAAGGAGSWWCERRRLLGPSWLAAPAPSPPSAQVGKQIAAFQGHHQRPWTITQREFCNNVHQVRFAAGSAAAGSWLARPSSPAAKASRARALLTAAAAASLPRSSSPPSHPARSSWRWRWRVGCRCGARPSPPPSSSWCA